MTFKANFIDGVGGRDRISITVDALPSGLGACLVIVEYAFDCMTAADVKRLHVKDSGLYTKPWATHRAASFHHGRRLGGAPMTLATQVGFI